MIKEAAVFRWWALGARLRMAFVFVLLILCASCLAANPTVPQGGAVITFDFFGTSGPANGQAWDILNPSSQIIATASSPAGWTFHLDASPVAAQVSASVLAPIASGYTIRSAGSGSPMSAVFDVVKDTDTPAAPPSNVIAYPGSNQITLNWGSSPGATGYQIWRCTQSGGTYGYVATVGAVVTYTDTGLTNGTTYYYLLASYNGLATSGWSNKPSATPEPSVSLLMPIAESPNAYGYLANPLASPSWAADPVSVDQTEAPSDGAASPIHAEPAYGVVEVSGEVDLTARNPVGNPVSFSRSYRTPLAFAGLSSPGLPAGWVHNYDLKIVSTSPSTWSPLTLVYPNGANETLTPTLSGGVPTGAFSHPQGSPYTATGSPGSTTGSWNSITLSPGGDAKQIFTFVGGAYRMTTFEGDNAQPLTVAYNSSGQIQSVATASNTVLLQFAYSGGVLSSVTAPQVSQYVDYNYTSGLLNSVNKPDSGTVTDWEYSYSTIGTKSILSSVSTNAPGLTASSAAITYDGPTGRPLKVTDELNQTRVYQYEDSTHSANVYVLNYNPPLVNGYYQTTGSTNNWTEFYDTSSRTTNSTTASGDPDLFGFDAYQPDEPNTFTQPTGGIYSATHDPATGNPTQYKGADGTLTNISYSYADSNFPLGLVSSIQEVGSSGTAKQATTFDYYIEPNYSPGCGFYGKVFHAYVPLAGTVGGTTTQTITYAYTSLGDLSSVSYPTPAGTATVTYAYTNSNVPVEQYGQPVSITTPSGTTSYTFDARGRITQEKDPMSNVTSFLFNDLDQLLTVTFPSTNGGNITLTYTYPEIGKPATVATLKNEAGTVFRTIDLSYDSAWSPSSITGNVRAVAQSLDPQTQITQAVDGNNEGQFKLTYNYPTREVSTNVGGNTDQATADTDGLLHTLVRPLNSNTYTLNRDKNNGDRVSSLTYPGSYGTLGLTYDQFGRIMTRSEPVGTIGYTYDDLDNVLTETITFTGQSGIVKTSTYYPSGQREYLDMAFPGTGNNGGTVRYAYTYDTSERLTGVKAYRNGTLVPNSAASYSYNANDLLSGSTQSIFSSTYGYDALSRKNFLANIQSGTAISLYSGVKYDAASNLLNYSASFSTVDGNPNDSDSETETFTYSLADELSTDVATHSFYGFGTNLSAGYDAGGTIKSLRGVSYTPVEASDQVSGFSYDADGNTTNPGTTNNYVYDVNDRISSAPNGETYGYWADGTRAWKVPPGGTKQYFLYDGMDMVAEMNSSLVPTEMYMFGAGGVTLQMNGPALGAIRAYFFDLLGNLAQRMNVAQQVTSSNTFYDAYGDVIADVNAQTGSTYGSPDWVGYKGQFGYYTDNDGTVGGDTGLLYCHSRYYGPQIGRWMTRDPAGLEGGVNPYDYCNGNPVTSADPLGRQSGIQLFAGDWSWGKYFGSSWEVFKGEGTSVNPVNWVKGLIGVGGYIKHNGANWDTAKYIGIGFIDGINIFNKDDPHAFGESMMNLELLLAPLGKKIPNPTRFRLTGFYGSMRSVTLLRIDDVTMAKEGQRFRFDVGEIPNKPKVMPWARGKYLPHYHRRGAGGMDAHRPFEGHF